MAAHFSDARTLHFLTQMSSTIRAGLPMSRTLNLLKQNEGPRDIRRVWTDVEQHIATGATFGEAMKRLAPPVPRLCAELLAAGEESGHLELVLQQLRRYYEMRSRLRRAALGAVAYPTMVAFFGFCVWTFLRVLTATDKYAAFLFMVTALVAGIAGVVAVVLLVGRTPPGRAFWDWIVLRMPLLGGAIRRLALARFARMFSMMYSSGMPMHLGLDRACAAAANMHIVRDLRRGHQRVRDGEELGEAFGACRYVPARMREMLLTGDAAGTYDDTLDHIAEIFEDEAEQVLTNLPKVIAPLALIAIGALVVFLFYTYYLRPYIIDPVNELFPQ